jgi:hypothetical protein
MGDDLLIRVFGYPQKGSLKWHTCCASSVVYFLHRADYRNEAAGTFKVTTERLFKPKGRLEKDCAKEVWLQSQFIVYQAESPTMRSSMSSQLYTGSSYPIPEDCD